MTPNPAPPRPDVASLFSDDAVRMDLLRERAHNMRWAELPPDVIALTAADPDFPVAREIRDAICDYVDGGVLSYGPPAGLERFRRSAARVARERKGLDCTWERVLATDSAAAAMHVVSRFVLRPGDEAIVFDPVDFLFQQSAEAAGATVVRSPIDPSSGAFDLDDVRRRITPRTRLVGLCNPHNPLGLVASEDELRGLGELALEHDLWIMSDEIWSDIVFEPARHVSLASLGPDIASRVLTVFGFSKSYGLAGLRIGFVVAPDDATFGDLLEASRAPSTMTGASTLSQIGAQAAYDLADPWLEAFLEHLRRLRDHAVERLDAMEGVTCRPPQGTYLLFPDVSSFGRSSMDVHRHLLEEGRVAVVPGAPRWFGPGAEGHLRIAFPTSRRILDEGLDRMEAALGTLDRA
ncbi:MAG: pyridoxal phosphate-dependent aminotransferase [Gemmatimonadota bacterium]